MLLLQLGQQQQQPVAVYLWSQERRGRLQVKTWFQNQRMKMKRCQKNTLWTAWIRCFMQVRICGQLNLIQNSFQPNSYLDVYPEFHQGYTITEASNIQTMPTPCQHYRAGQNAYPIVTSNDGGVFYKGGGTCSIQQTVSFIAQHKVDFYHSYPGSVEYSCTKTNDGYNFHQSAPMGASFPATASHQLYHF
ncbi:homeobox protein NANOG-like isoform X1 [Gallus gallus]|uniref:homeobox protein NANOG-like isoform X1 n=1 Tax=Gallus gallus TaxID=9031 RepID=UPI000D64089A|nr:homeobox protein NANOG-like isoform X1 [Gallus gallus]|eukprot:XP_024998497.1 homeobox protein NANOG-like isoform X1 [Gallus gallus]